MEPIETNADLSFLEGSPTECALSVAERGIAVVPMTAIGRPLARNDQATSDPKEIEAMFAKTYPAMSSGSDDGTVAGVMVVPGRSTPPLSALIVSRDASGDGFAALDALVKAHSKLPQTFTLERRNNDGGTEKCFLFEGSIRLPDTFDAGEIAGGVELVSDLAIPVGNITNDGVIAPLPDWVRAQIYEAPLTLEGLFDSKIAPPSEIVEGLIERGTTTILSAPGGSHKSRFGLLVALGIAANVSIIGRNVEQAYSLLVDFENGPAEIRRRAQDQLAQLGITKATELPFRYREGKEPLLSIAGDLTVSASRQFDGLRGDLKLIEGRKLVVLDSAVSAIQFAPGVKMDNAAAYAAIGALNDFCRETDSTILLINHPSYAGMQRGDASGWSVGFHDAPRGRLSLKVREDGTIDLTVEKRNNAPAGEVVRLKLSGGPTGGILLPLDVAAERDALAVAIVAVAIESAEAGSPISRRGAGYTITPKVRAAIKDRIGKRTGRVAIVDALDAAVTSRKLIIVERTKERMGGLYPGPEEYARELAIAARKKAGGAK